jgi:hypothetical protein
MLYLKPIGQILEDLTPAPVEVQANLKAEERAGAFMEEAKKAMEGADAAADKHKKL